MAKFFPGKKVFRKGYRTINWHAHDDNGDTLRYVVSFRPKGTDRWLRLRDNLDETSINFDTSQLPDGTYELRLAASDAADNPDNPLTDVKEGVTCQVDNTPPSVTFATEGDDAVNAALERKAHDPPLGLEIDCVVLGERRADRRVHASPCVERRHP